MIRFSPGLVLLLVASAAAACEGDVFPIRVGEEATLPMGGGDVVAGTGGMSQETGGTSSGGDEGTGGDVMPVGGMGGVAGPVRTLPLWGEPIQVIPSVPGGEDQDPAMSPDGLELYFNSSRAGGVGKFDIFRATRATVDDEWGTPVPMNTLNSAENEATPFVSSDGLTIWFARAVGSFTIFEATRPTINDPWSTPVQMPGLGGDSTGIAPAVTADGLTFYVSKNGENLDVDIFRATRTSLSDPFGELAVVTSLQSPGNDWDVTTQDDLIIYFNREANLYGATRGSDADPFGGIEPLPELNTEFQETDPWLSLDGKTLLFSSDRMGQNAIYEARRD